MIKLQRNSKVYVHCPSGRVTGGAELLHQLVDVLNRNNVNAYIVYFGNNEHTIPSDYTSYNIKMTDIIEDSPCNVEVIYEGRFDLIRNHIHIQKILWWLSVDHFFLSSTTFLSIIDLTRFNLKLGCMGFVRQVGKLIKNHDKTIFKPLSLRELREYDVMNAYQSEYAQNFLQNNGFKEMMPMKDFINSEHQYDSSLPKEDFILYNPKKGIEFTRKLIKAAPDLNWVPLQGMNRKELIQALRKAKLYIDFGYHPGKDRLPRECAMNGCCIITGFRGSAGFYEDVAIPNKYKFADVSRNVPYIIERIRDILSNYEDYIDDFKMYRTLIGSEKQEFENQVLTIFDIDR